MSYGATSAYVLLDSSTCVIATSPASTRTSGTANEAEQMKKTFSRSKSEWFSSKTVGEQKLKMARDRDFGDYASFLFPRTFPHVDEFNA